MFKAIYKVVIEGKVETFDFQADEGNDAANVNRCLAFYQEIVYQNTIDEVKEIKINLHPLKNYLVL